MLTQKLALMPLSRISLNFMMVLVCMPGRKMVGTTQHGMEFKTSLRKGLKRISTFLFKLSSNLSPVFTNNLLGFIFIDLNAELRTIPCKSSVVSNSISSLGY